MKLYFKTIRWRNFLNTGHQFTEVDLTKTKTTLITGRNGVGKSALLDALTFALYGKPFRNINKPQLVNSINAKDMLVELEFETRGKQYLVRRGIKPAVFDIEENGQLIPQDAATGDYQRFLEQNLIQMTFKSFTQICVLGKANYTGFMNLAAADRRKIIEDLLDLNLFSSMNVLLKEEIATLKTNLTQLSYEQNLTDKLLEDKYRMQAKLQENVGDLLETLNAQIATAEQELIHLQETLPAIDTDRRMKLEIQRDTNEAQRQSFIELGASVGQQTKRFETEHAFFHNNETCPTCSQSITEELKASKIAVLDKALTENRKGTEIAQARIQALATATAALKVEIATLREAENNMIFHRRQITAKEAQIKKLKEAAEQAQIKHEDDGTLATEIADLEIKKATLENQAKEYSLEKETLDVAAVLLKDGGIKKKIIAQYMPVLNKTLQKYLNMLDFYVLFELDETFSETVKSRNMETFSYNSFSEGQKARIELALLFTWRELARLRNNSNTNLLILDEVFDGSLEAEGGDDLLNLIREISENTNVFVISHKNDAYVEKFDRKLEVRMARNFSMVVEV